MEKIIYNKTMCLKEWAQKTRNIKLNEVKVENILIDDLPTRYSVDELLL